MTDFNNTYDSSMDSDHLAGDLLPVAVRAYMELPPPDEKEIAEQKPYKPRRHPRPTKMIILDCETATENTLNNPKMPGFDPDQWPPHAQALLFGSAHFYTRRSNSRKWKKVKEWTFYNDLLPKPTLSKLRRCWNRDNKFFGDAHEPVGAPGVKSWLMPLSEWLDVFYDEAVSPLCLIVGFNLPFDLSRLATRASAARNLRYLTGFSFKLWRWTDLTGRIRDSSYRPRLLIRQLGEKARMMKFSAVWLGGNNEDAKYFYPRGELLDLAQLCRALTGESLSLDGACQALGLDIRKSKVETHGVISQKYFRYNRQDIETTFKLTIAALKRFDLHPISRGHKLNPGHLSETRVYSAASLAKAYYRLMKIEPRLTMQPDFPRWASAASMEAYYGGRTECKMWNMEVPIAPLDLTSAYPTVLALQKLWAMVIARDVKIIECRKKVQNFLSTVTSDDLFKPETWDKLNGFVQILPRGDIVPVRARYQSGEPWKIGVNPYYSESPQWYSIADLAASRLLGGPAPEVLNAFRLVAGSKPQPDLRLVKFGGVVDIDPERDNFFTRIVEERAKMKESVPPYDRLTEEELEAGSMALKITANAGAYGVFVETNVEELPDEGEKSTKEMDLWPSNNDEPPHRLTTTEPELPGPFAFYPIGSLICAGARLLLALLQHEVEKRGGTYAFCDTDSLAILSHPNGGSLSDVPGSKKSVELLTPANLERIYKKFELLNPYDPKVIPHLLKREHSEHDVLYALSLGSKRYALYTPDQEVVEWKELALGAILPTNGNDDGTDWTQVWWEGIIRRQPCPLPDGVLVHRHSIQTATTWKLFSEINFDKPYMQQVKPFNFLILASRDPLDADRNRGPVIAPFESDPSLWMEGSWLERSTGDKVSITTDLGEPGTEGHLPVCVRTLHGYYREYISATPTKFRRPPDGQPGLLRLRPVRRDSMTVIGKESHPLVQNTDAGLVDFSPGEITSPDDDWSLPFRPVLRDLPLKARIKLSKQLNVSLRTVRRWIKGTYQPDWRVHYEIEQACLDHAKTMLTRLGVVVPDHAPNILAVYAEMAESGRDTFKESLPKVIKKPLGSLRAVARRVGCDRMTLKGWGDHPERISPDMIFPSVKSVEDEDPFGLGLKRIGKLEN